MRRSRAEELRAAPERDPERGAAALAASLSSSSIGSLRGRPRRTSGRAARRAARARRGSASSASSSGSSSGRTRPRTAARRRLLGRVVARDPEHAAVRVGLEAEALDDAVGERLDGERREEAEAALVERERAHELEVLGHEPRVLLAEPAALEDAFERAREDGAVDRLQQVVGRAELHRVDGGLHVADARDRRRRPARARSSLMRRTSCVPSMPGITRSVSDDVEVAALEEVQRPPRRRTRS